MIEGLRVRELTTRLHSKGYTVDLWNSDNAPSSPSSARLYHLFPGSVQAWFVRKSTSERIICLRGMIKLVLYDRREGSSTRDRVVELFLGEYRFREVEVPPGVLRGWKAVGSEPALVLLSMEEEEERVDQQEVRVPYDWEIVMR